MSVPLDQEIARICGERLVTIRRLEARLAALERVAEAARMLDRAMEGEGRHDRACAAIIRALAALDDRKETENG